MNPSDLSSALSDIQQGNVTSGAEFMLQQVVDRKKDWWDAAFVSAVAVLSPTQVLDIERRLKTIGKDFSIQEFRKRLSAAKAALTQETRTSDPPDLLRSEKGSVMMGHENATIYFQTSPEWSGVLGYNEFTGGIEIRRPAPAPVRLRVGEEIDDGFDIHAIRWLERRSGLPFSARIVPPVVNGIAHENPFHPVREYLHAIPPSGRECSTCAHGCPWDGKPRLAEWLFKYCGVDRGSDSSPNLHAENVGRRFLISMVARIIHPGCKADHMLVLEGKTGIGKSSIAKALCAKPEWFTDQISELGTHDASQDVRGVWIVEFGDLDTFSRAEENTAKRFISQDSDRFRLPYGHRVQKFLRQCVFIGTTERQDWVKSETARRQWPVWCTSIDLAGLVRDRDLLMGEALHGVYAGEKWHLTTPQEIAEATAEQRKRFSEDVWRERVLESAKDIADQFAGWACVADILSHTRMNIPTSQHDERMSRRVGAILRMEGWVKGQKRRGGPPISGFYRPLTED